MAQSKDAYCRLVLSDFFMDKRNGTVYCNGDEVLIEGLVPEPKTLIKK
jgi:hypothetical protein